MGKTVAVLTISLAIFAFTQPAHAQQGEKLARIGILLSGSPKTHGHFINWLQRGFRNLGYVEGRTHVVVARWAMGKRKRLPASVRRLGANSFGTSFLCGSLTA